jgi:hypothetical protein
MKKCPYCAEEVQNVAIKCKHCGSKLSTQGANQKTSSNKLLKNLLIALAVVFIAPIAIAGFVTGFQEGMREDAGDESGFCDFTNVNYSIQEEADIRYDDATTYYVLIDPIDYSTDFKGEVKDIISEVSCDHAPKLSIVVFDDGDALQEYYRYDKYLINLSDEDNKLIETHFVASYDAYLTTWPNNHYLMWFPSVFTDHPVVGEFVETEEFRPELFAEKDAN